MTTPAPRRWSVRPVEKPLHHHQLSFQIVDEATEYRDVIAEIPLTGDEQIDRKNTVAIAVLMAAAPDLLAACQLYITARTDAGDGMVDFSTLADIAARVAIAKATTRTPDLLCACDTYDEDADDYREESADLEF